MSGVYCRNRGKIGKRGLIRLLKWKVLDLFYLKIMIGFLAMFKLYSMYLLYVCMHGVQSTM